jgi:autotransporter-associated beta strand protein
MNYLSRMLFNFKSARRAVRLSPAISRLLPLVSVLLLATPARAFLHPGGLHTQTDFDRMAAKVAAGAHPWVDSYNQLTAVSEANLGWGWAPVGQIIRGVSPNNFARSQKDALAIYYLALRWRITGDTNYAVKAIQGCDAWSSTMTNGVGGNSNFALGAGICGYEFSIAGEALRGYTNWSQASMNAYSNFLMLFYGGNEYFIKYHNGTCDSHYWCNWDACNLASMMAIGVFCDNTNIFNETVNYMKTGIGNGNLTSAAWYIHTNGLAQWQESGRDQAHTMDGVMWLGVACQIAWNQGVDLYGFDNNRFLRGIEYVAKYNLWNNVPFVSFGTCDSAESWGTTALSSGSRGATAPQWDMFYNHYVNIKGLQAPWTAAAAAAIRPDGFFNNPNSPDFVGFSTLTCYRDPIVEGAVPSGLTANASGTNVTLTWWGSAYATNYLVKRATISGGSYTTIATIPASSDRVFTDTTATNGATYYYVVSEQDKYGESPNSPERAVTILNQLVAYYKFDESSAATAVADSSGFDRPSATLVNGASFVGGKYGDAVSLNGSSQYVALPYGLIKGLNDFTIAAWVHWNGGSSWQRIFDFGADIDRYMFLTPSDSSTIRFAISKFGGNGEQRIDGTAPLPTGWHHVAVTLQESEGAGVGVLYVDGQPVGMNASMSYTPDMIGSLVNATNNYIGRSQFPGDPYLNGRVDDFRIYNGALSANQIQALYANGPSGVLAAPATVSATAASSHVINLSWTAVSGATNYVVQRSVTESGPYTIIACGVTVTNYTDTGLSGGTTYFYVVSTVNSGGSSTNSSGASATTLTPPAAPTGLNATGLYGGQIALSWNPSSGAMSYNVKRSLLSGGPYVTIATGVTSTTHTNSSLVFNATYYYVVSAVDANGESSNSIEARSIVPVPTLTWKGNVNTTWDINTTSNWLFNTSAATYLDGSATIFNDTASRSSLNLSANVEPNSMVFSNSTLNYTLSSANGSGIGGSGSLTKSGSGTLTLNTANDFSGEITLNAGAITLAGSGVLGDGDYPGDIDNYGTLNFNSNASQILSGGISKFGSVVKNGSGVLTLSGMSSFSGNLFVKSGQTIITTNGSVHAGYYCSIGQSGSDNGTLTLNGTGSFSTSSDLNIGDIGSSVGTLNILDEATLSVNAFFIGSANASGSTARGTVNMNGGTLTENNTTVGNFTIGGRSSATSGGVGALNLSNGTINATCAIRLGNYGTGTINQYGGLLVSTAVNGGVNLHRQNTSTSHGTYNLNGGTLETWNVTTSYGGVNSLFYFNGGRLQAATSGTLMNNLAHAYVRNSGALIDDGGFAVTVSQPLEHSTVGGDNAIDGGLTKVGSGTLTLTANNTYTGDTAINDGTLAFDQATLPASGTVTVASGAVLDLNFLATDRVGALVLNGVSQPPGVYNSGNSFPSLAGTGSLLIPAPIASNPPLMAFTNLGDSLVLSWPANHTGWQLQAQTNSLNAGLGTNWVDVVSSTNVNELTVPLNAANGIVFYRLVYP